MPRGAAAERWRRALEAWALPRDLLDSVSHSPYGSPPVLWRRTRRAEMRDRPGETVTLVKSLLPAGGSLLDVGAGTGRVSLPFAAAGHPVTAVEPAEAMAEGLRAEARELAAEPRLVVGRWPEAAPSAGRHDVVVCANVVYDVADLAPFLTALDEAARVAVVVELTPVHPWSHLAPYFRALHGLELPREPTAALCCEVVAETLGVDPSVRAWRRRGVHRFADRQELLAYYGRRLLVPAERADELERVLGPDIGRDGGWLVLGDVERESVTVSWVTGSR